MSRVLAALGPSVRDRMLDGRHVIIKAHEALPADLLSQLVARAGESYARVPGDRYRRVEPTADDLRRVSLTVEARWSLDRSRLDESLVLRLDGVPIQMKAFGPKGEQSEEEYITAPRSWMQMPIESARVVAAAKELEVRPAPDVDAVLDGLDPPPGMKELKSEEDWNLPMLQAKVKLELPKEAERLTQSEALRALARAADLDIICEDFATHRYDSRTKARGISAEMTVKDVLGKVNGYRPYVDKVRWFADADRRRLVGWAGEWREHYRSLVPASMLRGLSSARERGAELDDMTPVLRLSRGQYHEWLGASFEFHDLRYGPNMSGGEQAVWCIYDALSPAHKALARSDDGLPLQSLDTAWIARTMGEVMRVLDESIIHTGPDDRLPPEYLRKRRLFSDPAFVSQSVMRVKAEPLESWGVYSLDTPLVQAYRPGPDGVRKHCYAIELTGVIGGKEEKVVSRWEMMPFPSFSPEKEAEPRERAEGDAGQSAI